jgi:hypothetical protein
MKEVLVTMGIRKEGGKRVSLTTWMGHEAGRGGDRERSSSRLGGRRRGDKMFFGDNVKWK